MNDRILAVIHRASVPSRSIIRLYDITLPSQLCSSGRLTLGLSLQLPQIEAGVSILSSRILLPRVLQEQVLESNQRPREVFLSNSGIMALTVSLTTGSETAKLVITIDVAMLLSIAHMDIHGRTMPWSEWGARMSRVFLIREVVHANNNIEPLQDVEGYRVAFSANVDSHDTSISEGGSGPAAFILDFNPATIRWARGEEKAGRGLRGDLVTEPSILRPGHLLAEEVISSLPFTRTMLEGYLPNHQIRFSRDEVVYPANQLGGPPLPNTYSFV
ncbi:hypothetical protein AZE42_05572 [Rhizopogon vesiculosus]|uniref:Uncharacterized protein n=1 Tax=Rhizopogon vesiculosus TaxID=180088 RepID=A0A1J8Q0L5_9AGAM|nr:hypothetical protein AZE42_05572 [Rhizopogon vesiculosus]